jgi:hypothetical protein
LSRDKKTGSDLKSEPDVQGKILLDAVEPDQNGSDPVGRTTVKQPKNLVRKVKYFLAGIFIFPFGVWLTWPLWGDLVPESVSSSVAPLMEIGRSNKGLERERILVEQVSKLENEIANLKQIFFKKTQENFRKIQGIEAMLDNVLRYDHSAHEKRIKKLESDVNQASANLAQATDLVGRFSIVQEQLQKLRASDDRGEKAGSEKSGRESLEGAVFERLKTLEEQIRKFSVKTVDWENQISANQNLLKSSPSEIPISSNLLMMAVYNLQFVASRGVPFTNEWESVFLLAKNRPEIGEAMAILKPFMKTGFPTLSDLRQAFAVAADAATRALRAPKGNGWFDKIILRFSSLITVRRTGSAAASGNTPEASIARAELAIAQGVGDVNRAVSALKDLPQEAAASFQEWLRAAEHRKVANGALNRIRREMLRLSVRGPAK